MDPPTSVHEPVLVEEVLQWLDPRPGQVFADGTLGGGGHTRLLAGHVGSEGRVISVDVDPAALQRAEQQLAGLPVSISQASFAELPEVLDAAQVAAVHGILIDLGLSSDQLADQQRGFSFHAPGPLDLRFNPHTGEPAWQLIHRLSADHLADLIHQFGEERYSRRIARAIVAQRQQRPIKTAAELAELVRRSVPAAARRQRIDPATRTFQALRIAVNSELTCLKQALRRLPHCVLPGGRLAVISFHSLEDRLVKVAFRQDDRLSVLTKKPVRPTPAEVERNPRARSARLRVAERIPG